MSLRSLHRLPPLASGAGAKAISQYWYGYARAELRAARESLLSTDRAWHVRRARGARELARYFRRLEALPS